MLPQALDSFLQDLRFGARTLRKSPGFTAIAVVTLALGIGVNAAIFSIFNAVALRPLAAAHPERLVTVDRQVQHGFTVLSWPDYRDIRDSGRMFEEVAAWTHAPLTFGPSIAPNAIAEDARGMMVTDNYFRVFGIQPVLGRFFIPEEGRTPGASRVVVLSEGYWRRRFGGDKSVVGRTVLINLQPFTIIGIAPESFVGPDPMPSDMWLTVMMQQMFMHRDLLSDSDGSWLHVIGLLKAGTPIREAQAEMDVLWSQMKRGRRSEPGERMSISRATFLPPNGRPVVMPMGILVLVATSMVLLIACANVANLLLARASARQREIAVRLSLGAGRARLIRQLLTESSLLAAMGAVLSYAFFGKVPRLLWMMIPQAPVGFDFSPDVRVITYTAALVVIAAVAFGLMPALHATRGEINRSLRVRHTFVRGALVTVQVAVCLALLAGAGLLTRALGRAQTVNVGFNTKDVVTLSTDARLHNYDAKRLLIVNDAIAERVRSLHGVQSVAQVVMVPLSSNTWMGGFSTDPRRKPDGPGFPIAGFNEVSALYFETLQIPIVSGRSFTDAEVRADRQVAVISASTARTFWPGQNPVGKHFLATATSRSLALQRTRATTNCGAKDRRSFISRWRLHRGLWPTPES
ncbi:MAG TPA: ABC transporter permease [Bryobacteraceae bacterium]|nr:ABC transporter permease [Bryobacteraceae bacterium]